MGALYAGIDLHSNNNVVVVTDETDKVLCRARLRNEVELVVAALAPFGDAIAGIAVESTYNWYWLVDGLMDRGYRLHLANTTALTPYSGLKYSDDDSDARWLAKLLRLDILPEGYIYPKEDRPVRDLLRKRRHLVRQKTSNLLSVKNLLNRNTGRSLSANAIWRLCAEDAEELLGDPDLVLAVGSSLAVLKCLKEQIGLLEKRALERARPREEFNLLLTVPGVGQTLALVIALETGDARRFATAGDYASYARCVNSERISNGKRKGKGNAKCGNPHLAWAFFEAATFAIRYDTTIQRYYQRKRARSSHVMVARKAVAHKLARACYHMLREGTVFDLKRAFG